MLRAIPLSVFAIIVVTTVATCGVKDVGGPIAGGPPAAQPSGTGEGAGGGSFKPDVDAAAPTSAVPDAGHDGAGAGSDAAVSGAPAPTGAGGAAGASAPPSSTPTSTPPADAIISALPEGPDAASNLGLSADARVLVETDARPAPGPTPGAVDARPADAVIPPDTAPPSGFDDPGCAATDPTLSACFRFEGHIEDESSLRHATAKTNVDLAAGETGQALSVGPSGQVRLKPHETLQPSRFTVEAWVQPRSLPGVGARMGIIDNDGQFGLFVQPGGLVQCASGGLSAVATGALRVGTWTSVACTHEPGNELVLWIDGKRAARHAGTAAPGGSSNGIAIGSNSPTGDHFDGLIDNVRIWRDVRKNADICAAARGCR